MTFRILVPTDFSMTAEKALNYALNIASKNNGIVYLLNAFTPIEHLLAVPEELREKFNLQCENESMNLLRSLKTKWQKSYANVEISLNIGTTPLVNCILGFAKDNDVNIIIIGTQGASGLKKAFIGSNATAVLKKTNIPLLLVPEEFNWDIPRKIVIATNYEDEDIEALTMAGELANIYGASVEIVHLPKEASPDEQTTFFKYINKLKQKFPYIPLASSFLPTGSTLECIHDYVPYDLLVMVKRNMSLIEHVFDKSQTKHMACITKFPLMVVPTEA